MNRYMAFVLVWMASSHLYAQSVLAFWDNDVNAPTWSDTNLVTATSFKTGALNDATWGSTDGTFGSLNSPSADTALAGIKAKDGETMDIKLVNTSGADLNLDMIHFDFSWAFSPKGPKTITLVYKSGDLAGSGSVIGTYTAAVSIGKAGNYNDLDWSFSSGLEDTVLAAGEYAVFEFQFSNATDPSVASGLDNIAITVRPIETKRLSLVVLSSK